jgi:hypothetical protein
VHLVREPDADLVEHVEDRVPAPREVGVPVGDHLRRHRREHGHIAPDLRAGEADHRVHPELGRGPRGVGHLGRRPLPHALRVAVGPDPRRQDVAVPVVDRVVAHRLADQVVGDRPHPKAVRLEHFQLRRHVAVVGERAVHLEVITGAGDLQTVIAPLRGQLAHLLERQVRPLAGEQGDRSAHCLSSQRIHGGQRRHPFD